MTLPEVVTTERLRLPLWTPEEAADILAGDRRDFSPAEEVSGVAR